MQGRDDMIVPQRPALLMRDRLRAAGVPAAVLLLPFADYAFDMFGTDWSPMARVALWHAERFIELIVARQNATRYGQRRAPMCDSQARNWATSSV
jgi:hypothetical protein